MAENYQDAKFKAQFRVLSWYRSNVPCMEACPVHTDSGRYVQLIAEGRFEEAFLVARAPNPLASICGRICSAPCEDACRRGWVDQAITIRPLKRFVTEQYGAESAQPEFFRRLLEGSGDPGSRRMWHVSQLFEPRADPTEQKNRGNKKVAIIGSGPAGLGCAHDLALLGYDVTVFEAQNHPGGMLRYGIPNYRLPREVIEREIALIEQLGVTFKTSTPLTPDYNLSHLRAEGFEAFFLSVGATRGRDLSIPGCDKDGVIKAVDYLLNLNRGYRVDLGNRVVIIGGGSVALDAARTAVREFYEPMEEIELTARAVIGQPAMDAARGALRSGASEVHVISLESLEELPAARTVQGKEELHEATAEGIQLHPSWGPKEIHGDKRVTSIDFVRCTRVYNESGRFDPQFDTSRTMNLPADSVILAIGQQADFSFLTEEDRVEITHAGTIKIDPQTLATSAPGVFAGGDVAFGPRIAIEAVANGKTAAQSIHAYLGGAHLKVTLKAKIDKIPIREYRMPASYEKRERRSADTVNIDRRTGITEVENVMTEEQACSQAERCLACHIDTIYDPERCVLCGRCADVCPERCLIFVPLARVEMPAEQRSTVLEHYGYAENNPLTVLLKDDTACIRCGLCALRCPTEAMTMERFNFVESAE